MRLRLRSQFQKDGYGAKAGQVIRGNLARGGDGQFTSAGNASASAPKEKPKKLTADELRAKREAEREERQAKRDAEREARLAQREAERQARLAQREAERKAKAELAAKNKKGGGGGGKKKDDKDAKAAEQAKKDQGKKAEQRRKERQAERKDQARAAERQQAQAQRQAEAQQRRADTQARQQASAAERASRQQAQAQRQQQTDAQRAQRDTERKARQAASDTARAQRDADRKARQAAMDARRAKLDAAREKMQAQMAARRDAAEARANAKFGAWQKDQASKPKGDGKDTKAPSTKDTKAPSTNDPKTQATAPASAGAMPAAAATPGAAAPVPAPKPSRKERRRRQHRSDGAQKSASIVLAKREASTRTFAHSFAIAKVDAEQRIVEGIASSEVPDRQPGLWKGAYYAGDIVAAEAIAAALPGYLEYGNIREMHQPSAVGVVLSAEMRERQLYLVVKVVDDAAWQKVVTGVYKGFSIGGACDDAEIIKEAGRAYRKITALTLTEISLVDRPANPAARFTLWKGTGMENEEPTGEELAKGAGDPTKAIAALQQLRDAAELDGDLNAAQAYSLAIAAALEGAGIAQPDEEDAADEEEPVEEVEAPEDELAMAEGLDELPDDEAIVAMASRIGDIAKVGRSVSGANLAHLTSIHDAIKKIAGDALCKAEDVAAEPEAQIAQAQPSGDLQKVAGLEAQIAELQKRLDQVESQPVAGGPVLRAADKQLPGEQPAAPVRKSTRSRADLQRLSQTEPNAQLRAQYAAELAALDK